MATVADYQVLFDGNFTLGGNAPIKTLKFAVPTTMVFGSNAAKPIIAFKIRPTVNVQLKIEVNHEPVMGPTNFNESNLTRGHWTIFNTATAFPEGSSLGTVDVRFICHTEGTVHIEDVVIWYQVNN